MSTGPRGSERGDDERGDEGRLIGVFPMETQIVLVAIRRAGNGEEKFFNGQNSEEEQASKLGYDNGTHNGTPDSKC